MVTTIIYPQNWINSIFQAPSSLSDPLQIHHTFVPLASALRYLDTVLDLERFYTQHLHTFTNKAKAVFYNISPLLIPDSTLKKPNNLTLYKLFIRSFPIYAVPVCRSKCPFYYFKLQVIQSKCLRVIGNHPRCTSASFLHDTVNMEPIPIIIHRLAAKLFCSHLKRLLQQIANYTLADKTNTYWLHGAESFLRS